VILSLVAEQDGVVVGHILLSPVRVDTPGAQLAAVGLGPMAVLPELQRRGIGRRLIEESLERLRSLGHEAVVVVGHPQYYPRFGFMRASQLGLRWEMDCPNEAFMAMELRPGALAGRAGVVRYHPEFGSL
jgi:putative acetyltransferase